MTGDLSTLYAQASALYSSLAAVHRDIGAVFESNGNASQAISASCVALDMSKRADMAEALSAMHRGAPITPENALRLPVQSLPLPTRVIGLLSEMGATTVGDVTKYSEASMLKQRGFGRAALRQVQDALTSLGLALETASPRAE